MKTEREERTLRRQFSTVLELRDQTDSEITFTGHASVTDAPYALYGGPAKGGWNETVVSGAFKRTLNAKPDVVFLVNHDGLPLARTKSGTLSLSEDSLGLAVEARLNAADPDVQRLVPKIERGDVTEMSFAFRILKQQWLDASGQEVDSWLGTERRILQVDLNRGDVSTVTFGANPKTAGTLRTEDALAEIARLEPELFAALRSEDAEVEPLARAARAALDRLLAPAPTMTLAHLRAIAATI